MKNCPFCIKNHRDKIFETKTEFVIYNMHPGKNKGRCCVIPKRHIENIKDFTNLEIASFFKTVKLVTEKLSVYLKTNDFNFGWNQGKFAGQTIKHFHLHTLPRYKNDELPEFHLFHRHPKNIQNLSSQEMKLLVKEFKELF